MQNARGWASRGGWGNETILGGRFVMENHSTVSLDSQSLPPMFNKGVTELSGTNISGVSASLDWLRYTVHWPDEKVPQVGKEQVLRAAVHPSVELSFTGELLGNPMGYNNCWAMTYGSVRFHSERPEPKIGVEVPGQALSGFRLVDVSSLYP